MDYLIFEAFIKIGFLSACSYMYAHARSYLVPQLQRTMCIAYMYWFCRRNLEYYDTCHNEKVRLCDSDCTANSGELTIKIPKDTYSTPGMGEAL